MIKWIARVYEWLKNNLLIAGAIIGISISFFISLLFRRGNTNQVLLDDKEEANDARAEKDQQVVKLTDKFSEDLDKARDEAQKAGEQLSLEQEQHLAQRLEAYSTADSDKDKEEIRKDIKRVFPWMKMVKPTEFGVIE